MGKTEDLIKDYQDQDACGRMCLYLQYTDLREEFLGIERVETGPVPEIREKPGLMARIKTWLAPALPAAVKRNCC